MSERCDLAGAGAVGSTQQGSVLARRAEPAGLTAGMLLPWNTQLFCTSLSADRAIAATHQHLNLQYWLELLWVRHRTEV